MSKGQGFTWKSPHHFYWGVIISLAGFVALFHVPAWLVVLPVGIMGFGLWVVIDDIVQHSIQLITGNFDFHTPWHNWYWGLLNWLLAKTPEGSWLRRVLEWMKTV